MGAALRHGWNIWMIKWAVWAMCSTSATRPKPCKIQTQDEGCFGNILLFQSCEDGLHPLPQRMMDGGQLNAPELTIQEAREHILEAHHMEKGRRLLQDYDAVMDKVAEAEELRTDHRPSTLEKLAELASLRQNRCTFCARTVRWTMQQKWNQNFDGEPMTDMKF